MDILGIIVIVTLPYMAGYILKSIVNKKEIRQIETYLTGFFFVFFAQGIVAFVQYFWRNQSFEVLCKSYNITLISIAAVFMLVLLINIIIRLVNGKGEKAYHPKWHKIEFLFLAATIILCVFIVFRVIGLQDYLRDDIMLPTIRTTLATNTIYEYNPITSQQFTLGLINSKRLISLPIFYAYICRQFGISEPLLIYVVMTIQTMICTFFACHLFIIPVLRNRGKNVLFSVFLATLILSGDYFSGSIGFKLLWNGYSGDAIVAGAILPYVMYVITDWYRSLRSDEGKNALTAGIVNSLKLLLCIGTSIFITGITSGVLLILIEIALLGIACLVRYRVEEGRK